MTVWIGTKPAVILSSLESVRTVMIDNQHDFASRPDSVPRKFILLIIEHSR